jgi:hypothetical protein
MRKTEVRLASFQAFKFTAERVTFPDAAAQEGVDETGLGTEPEALGEFDRFVDGGMIGNAVEPEELVKAEAKKDLEQKLLGAPVGATRNQPIEGGLPADGAEGKFPSEAAVVGGKLRRGGKGVVEQVFNPTGASGVGFEDVNGNFSWFFGGHEVIVAVAQLQSSF